MATKYRKLADLQTEHNEKTGGMVFAPCCNCGKAITDGYYGRYGDGGVCSKTCNTAQAAKPKYPPTALEA